MYFSCVQCPHRINTRQSPLHSVHCPFEFPLVLVENVCIYIFCPLPPGKEAPAGSSRFPGGQSNQLPASRHHHAGGAAVLDVPPHPQGQAAGKRQPAAATDLQRGSLLWGTARVSSMMLQKRSAKSCFPSGK